MPAKQVSAIASELLGLLKMQPTVSDSQVKVMPTDKQQIQEHKLHLCASLILEICQEGSGISDRLADLKRGFGASWSITSALQFLSGKTARAVIDQQPSLDQPRLMIAHLVAREICSECGLGNVDVPDGIDLAEFDGLGRRLRSSLSVH